MIAQSRMHFTPSCFVEQCTHHFHQVSGNFMQSLTKVCLNRHFRQLYLIFVDTLEGTPPSPSKKLTLLKALLSLGSKCQLHCNPNGPGRAFFNYLSQELQRRLRVIEIPCEMQRGLGLMRLNYTKERNK